MKKPQIEQTSSPVPKTKQNKQKRKPKTEETTPRINKHYTTLQSKNDFNASKDFKKKKKESKSKAGWDGSVR